MSEDGWGRRWLASLGSTGHGYAERLGRGPYYVSRGAVRSLEVSSGLVSAVFSYGRQRAQRVTVQVEPLDDAAWEDIVRALATELRFTAAVSAGELPVEIAETLAQSERSLVPRPDQVTATCSCTETGGDPCRHVAAVHHALADELDDEPFTLLSLRGRDPRSLAAMLRAARTGEDLATASRSSDAVGIDELDAVDPFAARGDLTAVRVHPRRVEDPAWLFDQLGEPPGIDDSYELQMLIVRAADTAWRIAAGEGAQAADTELLLTELRAQRMTTAPALAGALGWDEEVVTSALDDLYAAGAVMRMGTGTGAKYRAAS